MCVDRESLNAGVEASAKYRLFAEKDGGSDCISLSELQLGGGTVLVVDERRMAEGPLTETALKSLRAIEAVVKLQMLPIEFEYCPGVQIPTDICVVIFSDSPTIISDSALRCHSPSDIYSVDNPKENLSTCDYLDTAHLRRWWAHCKVSDASLDAAMIKYVEEDFVSARQGSEHIIPGDKDVVVSAYSIEGADFHNWLTVARICALAKGSSNIDRLHWSHMRELEWNRHLMKHTDSEIDLNQ